MQPEVETKITTKHTESGNSSDVLNYRMRQVEIALKEGLHEVRNDIRQLRDGFVSHQQLADATKTADMVHTDHDKRITKLENWNVWLVRMVGGAIILAVLALVLHGNMPV